MPMRLPRFHTRRRYYWTPFDPPQRGRAEIAAAWSGAVRGQRDIAFEFDVLAAAGDRGSAHWHTRFASCLTARRSSSTAY